MTVRDTFRPKQKFFFRMKFCIPNFD